MKKIFKVICVFVLLFGFVKAKAAVINIDTFIDKYKITPIMQLMQGEDGKSTVRIVKDETNHKIKVLNAEDDSLIVSFDYTDEYIMYQDLDTTITEEVVSDSKSFAIMFLVYNLQYTILDATNHSNKNIEFAENTPYNTEEFYNEYGIQSVSEKYDFERQNGDETSHLIGDYIRLFKVSLNSEKIDRLVSTFGVDAQSSTSVPSGLAPRVIVGSVESNAVWISANVNGSNEDEYMCNIYQSKSSDSGFEKSSDFAINCSTEGLSIKIEDLEPNTTYYFKAKILGGDTFSDAVTVKTKASSTSSASTTTTIKNPKTGVSSPSAFIVVALFMSISGFIILNLITHSKSL